MFQTCLVTKRPPRKCLPTKFLTPSFGAVRLIRTSGWRPTWSLSPSSTFQPEKKIIRSNHRYYYSFKYVPDGMSTETIGSCDLEISSRAVPKGGRTGGLKEKPNIASNITSDSLSLFCRSSSELIVGMSMFRHWV